MAPISAASSDTEADTPKAFSAVLSTIAKDQLPSPAISTRQRTQPQQTQDTYCWLTRDWDPAMYGYTEAMENTEPEGVLEDAPSCPARYRSVYGDVMKSSPEIHSGDTPSWAAPTTTRFSSTTAPSGFEYATLRFLEPLAVLAPHAHGFGLFQDPENPVGVGYILEDAMPGEPFHATTATPQQKRHVYEQYAEILGAISRHPFCQACSLTPSAGLGLGDMPPSSSAIASNRFLALGHHGPFASVQAYFASMAGLHQDLVADGQLYPNYPREAFLFYRLLHDRTAPALAAAIDNNESLAHGFFLKHVDDKGDHLLVDANYHITAIIDWQFARFVPAVEAFGPLLFTADLQQLYGDGTAGLAADDRLLAACLDQKGWPGLARIAAGSELARRFQLGLASGLSRDEVLGSIEAVLSLLGETLCRQATEAWLEQEWKAAAEDPRRGRIEALQADLANDARP